MILSGVAVMRRVPGMKEKGAEPVRNRGSNPAYEHHDGSLACSREVSERAEGAATCLPARADTHEARPSKRLTATVQARILPSS